jgi:RimJ/RimL family protein N-acetyltransferase
MLTHAFEVWRVHRVSLVTDARNATCRQAIQRLGARPDGVIRAARVAADATVRDTAVYSIVAPEWPACAAALRQRLR